MTGVVTRDSAQCRPSDKHRLDASTFLTSSLSLVPASPALYRARCSLSIARSPTRAPAGQPRYRLSSLRSSWTFPAVLVKTRSRSPAGAFSRLDWAFLQRRQALFRVVSGCESMSRKWPSNCSLATSTGRFFEVRFGGAESVLAVWVLCAEGFPHEPWFLLLVNPLLVF